MSDEPTGALVPGLDPRELRHRISAETQNVRTRLSAWIESQREERLAAVGDQPTRADVAPVVRQVAGFRSAVQAQAEACKVLLADCDEYLGEECTATGEKRIIIPDGESQIDVKLGGSRSRDVDVAAVIDALAAVYLTDLLAAEDHDPDGKLAAYRKGIADFRQMLSKHYVSATALDSVSRRLMTEGRDALAGGFDRSWKWSPGDPDKVVVTVGPPTR